MEQSPLQSPMFDPAGRDHRRPWLGRRLGGTLSADTITWGKGRDLAVASAIGLGIPYLATVFLPLGFPFKDRIDPSGYWFLPTLHQLAAAALTVLVMRIISTRPLFAWGFNLRHVGRSLAWVGLFVLLTSGPIYLLALQAPPAAGSASVGTVVAVLVTHLLVIGTTQEILFRSFVIGFLQQQWGREKLLGLSHAGWWAVLIFVVAHLKPYPPYFWPAQLALSFLYGLLYVRMFESTGSLLAPSLAHGFSNAAYVAVLMVLQG